MYTETVRTALCLLWLTSQGDFQTEIMNDEEEDEDLPTQPPSTSGDMTPAPTAGTPAEPSSSLQAPSQFT